MSQTNLLYRAQNLHQPNASRNTRPSQIDPVGANNQTQVNTAVEQAMKGTGTGKCPNGQRWSKQLMTCLAQENIDLYKQSRQPKLLNPPKEQLRQALQKYRQRQP